MKVEHIDRYHWKPGPVIHGFDIASGPDETVLLIRDGYTSAEIATMVERFKQDNPTGRVIILGEK